MLFPNIRCTVQLTLRSLCAMLKPCRNSTASPILLIISEASTLGEKKMKT